MTIVELGALGEFFSSIFVLITLIYLALQIRFLKRQTETQVTYNRGQGGREYLLTVANSPFIPAILAKMSDNIDHEGSASHRFLIDKLGLTTEEAYRINLLNFAWYKNQEANFGNLKDTELSSMNSLIVGHLQGPGTKQWWGLNRSAFNADFANHVDELAAERYE